MITKEAIEAAARALCRYGTSFQEIGQTLSWVDEKWPRFTDEASLAINAALPFLSTLPIAVEGKDDDAIETATLKERLRAATVARKAAREALEKGFLNRIPDRVFDAVHEASSYQAPTPNLAILDTADARSSTLEQKLKVATEALENIQQTRCDHDMGFDREIGPLGCSLGDKCVCVGLCTIASQALLETSALAAPSSPGKDGGQEVGSTHEERIALASALTWDVNNITPDEVREIINRLAAEGYRLQRIGLQAPFTSETPSYE